jgi:hypothetical protein
MKKAIILFVALTILVGGSIVGFKNFSQAASKTQTTTKKPTPKPIKKPVKPVVKPTAKPTKPVVKPTKPTVKPTKPVVKPTKPVVKPTKPVVKPVKPTPTPKPAPSEITGSLNDIADKLNAAIPEAERFKTMNIALTKDNVEYMLGTKEITYTEGVASDAMISAIPHSVVLIRVPAGTDLKATMDKIKKSANPRKWICVEVESNNVQVVNNGNLIMLVMSKNSDKYVDAFNSLKK